MEPFKTVTSHITPLPLRDVDTDMIIPAQHLTSISRDGYGQHLFTHLKNGDPSFPLNAPEVVGSKILVADNNFGCGSSREHAVWALMGFGYRVIIAKSFADIFSSNSGKNGLLLVQLPNDEVDSLLATTVADRTELTVDLSTQQISFTDGRSVSFEYDPFRKQCLLEGLDDIDYLRRFENEIDAFRTKQEQVRFYTTTQ